MRKLSLAVAIAFTASLPLRAHATSASEGPDFGGAPGNTYVLTAGSNVFSGALTSPTDTQDAFQITVPAGMSITAASWTLNAGCCGFSGSANVGNGSASSPGAISGTPVGAGTFQVIMVGDFAVNSAWVLTLTVGVPPCTGAADCSDGNACTDDVCSGGVCSNPNRASGSACGSSTSNSCTSPDTCNGAGVCQPNHAASGAPCGTQGVACQVNDTCNGSGSCTDNGLSPNGSACGNPLDDACTNPDTCNAGACQANDASVGAPCGDQGVACHNNDFCNGAGGCIDLGTHALGTPCGSPTTTACTSADTCDAIGNCQPNHTLAGAPCGDQGVACLVDDACDGSGACSDNGFQPAGSACGSATNTACTDPDSCNGSGTCQSNDAVAGSPCGDQGVACLVDDACDGGGACSDNGFQSAGTACGDATATTCTAPDACDAAGSCLANHASDGTACEAGAFCTSGDACMSGTCAEGSVAVCSATQDCFESMNMCVERCGNGVLDSGETCDAGGANSDTTPDACRTTCTVASCGDAVMDTGEACDNGAANSDTTAGACRLSCAIASCGDGVVDPGEGCDEGAANSDAAGATCRTTCAPAGCGDGVLDSGEQCDAGALNGDTAGAPCRTTCALPSCGDGVVDTSEACDDGGNNSDVTPDACRVLCVLPTCGDGVVDTGEACDAPGNLAACTATCMVPGGSDAGVDAGSMGSDAGTNNDGGVAGGAPATGCGCTTSGSPSNPWAFGWVLAAMAFLRWHRRRA